MLRWLSVLALFGALSGVALAQNKPVTVFLPLIYQAPASSFGPSDAHSDSAALRTTRTPLPQNLPMLTDVRQHQAVDKLARPAPQRFTPPQRFAPAKRRARAPTLDHHSPNSSPAQYRFKGQHPCQRTPGAAPHARFGYRRLHH